MKVPASHSQNDGPVANYRHTPPVFVVPGAGQKAVRLFLAPGLVLLMSRLIIIWVYQKKPAHRLP
jgi:hypothetical protein